MYYSIHGKLWAHMVQNIKESNSFRRDIIKGLKQKEGKLYLTQVGLDTCSVYNLPHVELSQQVEV